MRRLFWQKQASVFMAVYLVVQMKLWRRCLQGALPMIRMSIAITMEKAITTERAMPAERISMAVEGMAAAAIDLQGACT